AFDASELERKLAEQTNARDAATKEIEKKLSDVALARRDEELKIEEASATLRKSSLKVDRPSDLAGSIELATDRLDHELAEKELDAAKKRAEEAARADEAELTSLRRKQAHAQEQIKESEAAIASMSIPSPRDGTVVY